MTLHYNIKWGCDPIYLTLKAYTHEIYHNVLEEQDHGWFAVHSFLPHFGPSSIILNSYLLLCPDKLRQQSLDCFLTYLKFEPLTDLGSEVLVNISFQKLRI